MKVILLRDVAKIGRRSEIKEVPDGHALNFLIPRKLAEIATPQSLKRLAEQKSKQAQNQTERGEYFRGVLTALAGEPPMMRVDANEKGHLFRGVKAEDIAGCFETLGYRVNAKSIVLQNPLKELGVHEITLQQGDIVGTVSLTLQAIT